MRVLLANPPIQISLNNDTERYFIKAGSRWPHSSIKKKGEKITYPCFPFYLAYTAALLEKQQVEVQVLDAIAMNFSEEDFYRNLCEISPDIVLFETSTPTIEYDLQITKKIKKLTNSKIVLVGPHTTVFYQDILRNNPQIDFIFIREYELNFSQFIYRINNNLDYSSVPGIAYLNEQNKLIFNETSLTNLDELPMPARHLFPSNEKPNLNLYWDGFCQYAPAIQMHASRGCPLKCNFCLFNQVMYQEGSYRTFSPKRVVDEMEFCIQEYGAKEIYFDDDTFTGNKKHVLSICKEILGRNLKIRWSVMGDAMLTDEVMLEEMAKTGCIGLKFGVESGNQDILKNIGKPLKLDKLKGFCRKCSQLGIKTHATFTIGLLGETLKTMRSTLTLARHLDIDSLQVSLTTPFPGTRYFDELESCKYLQTKDWSKYDGATTSVVMLPTLDTHTIKQFQKTFVKKWILYKLKHPHWLLRQIKYAFRIIIGQGISGLKKKFRLVYHYLLNR